MKVLVVALLALLLSVQTARAQPQPIWPEEIKLDGQSFEKERLAYSFLGTVFTDDVLNKHAGHLNLLMGYGNSIAPDVVSSEYPWVYPFLYPQEGVPKLLVINKWVKPIRISFGLPNDLKPFQQPSSQGVLVYDPFKFDISKSKNFEQIVKTLSESASTLEQNTGLKISYLDSDSETLENYAELRVVFIDKPENPKLQFHKRQTRTFYTSYVGSPSKSFSANVEDHIKTGFPFTKESRNQIDGYFLTNEKNQIQMAVCYLWQDQDLSLIKKMLNECLVRSLGFPKGHYIYSNKFVKVRSYLTYWNDPEKWGEKESRKPIMPDENISEFDQFMIKTLYNPALKPGMDYVQAQKILLGLE